MPNSNFFFTPTLIVDTDHSSSSSTFSSISTSTTSHDTYSSNNHEQEVPFGRKRSYSQNQHRNPTYDHNRTRHYSHGQSLIARSLNKGQKIWQEAILDPDSSLMPWTKYCNDEKYASNENTTEPISMHSTPSFLHAYYRDNDFYPL